MSAGTAFARAASQPRVSGVRDFGIGADTSRHHQAIKHNSRLTENEIVGSYQRIACAGGPGSNASFIRESFTRHGGSALRAGLLRHHFAGRSTGGDQKGDCQKRSRQKDNTFDHGNEPNQGESLMQAPPPSKLCGGRCRQDRGKVSPV